MVNNKASLLALVASLLVNVTRATTSALATRREDENSSISRTDWGFTVVGIVCELYAFYALVWFFDDNFLPPDEPDGLPRFEMRGPERCLCWLCLFSDIGFQVGKLFPGPTYYCDSWACQKVTHVCVMTLCSGIFSLLEVLLVHEMVKKDGSKVPVLVKIIQYSVGLVFVLYEAATQNPPGAGTKTLITFTALAEILLIFLEVCTFWKYRKTADTALWDAARDGQTDTVIALLQAGVTVGSVPLFLAAHNGHTDTVLALLQAGATVDTVAQWRDKIGGTALVAAACNGHTDTVLALLQAGATVDTVSQWCDKIGGTALVAAACKGHTDTVLALLQAGATVDCDGINNPLAAAAHNGHTDTVLALLQAGAAVDSKDEDGDTPLYCAACEGHTDTVLALLQAGSTVDAKNKKAGSTPLLVAANFGHKNTVLALLQAGAAVDAKAKNEGTPLMFAACNGHTDTVLALLQAGATVDTKDKDGLTVLDKAKTHAEVVAILRAAGARE
jgi:ankyrin repeat protein